MRALGSNLKRKFVRKPSVLLAAMVTAAGLSVATAHTASAAVLSATTEVRALTQPLISIEQWQPTLAATGVQTADTFNFAVVGFNANGAGGFLTNPALAPTFGLAQNFSAGAVSSQTVSIISGETIGATTTTDTFTISVPTSFDPAGLTIGGLPVTEIDCVIGNYYGLTNAVDLTAAISPTPITKSGNMLYSGGSFSLSPTITLSNANSSLSAIEGVNAGGSDLGGFAIRSFTISATYSNVAVPEPTILGLVVPLGMLLGRRRNRLAKK